MSETEFARAQRLWLENCALKDRIEELESRIQKADDYIDTAIYDPYGPSLCTIQEILEGRPWT